MYPHDDDGQEMFDEGEVSYGRRVLPFFGKRVATGYNFLVLYSRINSASGFVRLSLTIADAFAKKFAGADGYGDW